MLSLHELISFFFCIEMRTTSFYTLSLHDALPILLEILLDAHLDQLLFQILISFAFVRLNKQVSDLGGFSTDRKSTRLNSSHEWISYAVFCLKKKSEII